MDLFDHLDRWVDPDMMTDEEREQRRQALAEAHPVHRRVPRIVGIVFAALFWFFRDEADPVVFVVALLCGFGIYLQGEWLVRRGVRNLNRPATDE